MKKMKSFIYAATATLVLSGLMFAVSCKKSSTTATEGTTSASDQATAEKSYSDAQTISEDAVATGGSSMSFRTTHITSSGCATVTTTASGGNTVVTINFGTSDCLCLDGRLRKGEIIVTYATGSWNTVGASRTITFNNYYQNDNQIQGTKTVTYEGLNSSGQPYYDIVINGSITYPSGKTVTVTWSRVRTWISGFTLSGGTSGNPIWSSGIEFSVSGTGTMVNSLGETVDVTIQTANPLIFAYDCKWIEGGIISYVLTSDGKTRSINYGSAPYTCHDTATVTLANGTTVTITLP